MSISERGTGDHDQGFSLVELLVGLALATLLAAAVAPLWLALEGTGSREADRTVSAMQGRVAVSRFERDLRLAGAYGCPFVATGPVLEASASQVVLLERPSTGSQPILVEWELARGALMRRWGRCPEQKPSMYSHSRYSDNKTMLESVGDGSSFGYVVNGRLVVPPVTGADLAHVEAVVLSLRLGSDAATGSADMATIGRVGR